MFKSYTHQTTFTTHTHSRTHTYTQAVYAVYVPHGQKKKERTMAKKKKHFSSLNDRERGKHMNSVRCYRESERWGGLNMRSCQDKDLLASHTHTHTYRPGNGLVSGVVWRQIG